MSEKNHRERVSVQGAGAEPTLVPPTGASRVLGGRYEIRGVLGRGYAEAGYAGALRKATDVEAAKHGSEPGVANDLAQNYVLIGDTARALDWLEKACDARDPNVPYITCPPMWDPLRQEPRFKALLRHLKLPEDAKS
jgi:hypothetical protein